MGHLLWFQCTCAYPLLAHPTMLIRIRPNLPSFQLDPTEQAAAIAAFDAPDKVQASGIRAAGQKYFTLQANDRSIYGKKGVSAFHNRDVHDTVIGRIC